ncbi:hypothetical protein SAMN06272735_8653 [Streptomyces sp. TLI_55]|uniref:hypothetical protein n=1 Tax=Streptomyces sp. TLI_55 TaxID=1938861 RepID=UPI000BC52A60|nr:hypothetical protein [Streptomyces sp. TLI_55]SNX88214.1 hypothetical protein SAMN06272735_8653 [Streptomyces sp. TLI_55]
MPTQTTHTHPHTADAEIVTRAWAEARSMAGLGPRGGRPPGGRPPGEVAAAALSAHGTLSAGLGRSVPFTALAPAGTTDSGVRQLAAFLAVYAAQQAA